MTSVPNIPELGVSSGLWRKPGRCDGGGQCVEVAIVPRTQPVVGVRDSQDVEGGHLQFGAGGWSAFIDAVKAGEFRP